MAQRLTASRALFYGIESPSPGTGEGVDPGTESGSTYLTVTNLVVSPDLAFFRRPVVGQMGTITGRVGDQTNPWIMFTMPCLGGVSSITPPMDPLLAVVLGSPQKDTGSASIASSPTPTSSQFTLSSPSGTFTPGNAIAVATNAGGAYEVGWILSYSSNVITLAEPLSFTPNGGNQVNGSWTYPLQNTGHGSLTFRIYLGQDSNSQYSMLSFLGCKGTVKFDVPAPGVPGVATFLFQAMAYQYSENVTQLTGTPNSNTPPAPYIFKLSSGGGTTVTNVKLSSWALRQSIGKKKTQNSGTYPSGTFSQVVTNRDLIGTVQLYDSIDTPFQSIWPQGTNQILAQQLGSTQYNIVAYRMPQVQYGRVTYGDDNGSTLDIVDYQGAIVNGADELRVAFM